MKVFKNDSVYVQNNDLAYLDSTDLGIPASIYIMIIIDMILLNLMKNLK